MTIGDTLINQQNFEELITMHLEGAQGELIKKRLEIIEQKDDLKAENIDEKKFDGSENVRLLKETFFTEKHKEKIREKLENKEIVYIKLPVKIKKSLDNKEYTDHIKIYFQKLDEKAEITTDCLLRNEYIIPKQSVCKKKEYCVIVLADKDDSPLSEAIREMEDEHHTKLDHGLANNTYDNTRMIVSLITDSADHILDIMYSQKSDLPEDFLNSFFSIDIPSEKDEKERDKTTKKKVKIKKKYLVPFQIKTEKNGFKIIPNKEESSSHKFPYTLDLESAIDDGSGKKIRSIKSYNENDFDFRNDRQFSFIRTNAGFELDSKSGNKISITLEKKDDFEFMVEGCNVNTDFVVRTYNYKKHTNWRKDN